MSAARRAERHADANLLRALARGVGDHAVDADEREHQPEQAHRAAEQRAHPQQQETVGSLEHPLHGRHIEDRQVRVEHADLALHRRRQRAGSPAVRSCSTRSDR